jgi:hypothetical protein
VAVQAAADIVAADLGYAKSMAVSRGQSYSVEFYIDDEKYEVQDQVGTVVGHPIKKGSTYEVDFANDSRFAQVDIESVDFDSTSEIRFDYLGTPRVVTGGVEVDLADPGVITLTRGSMTCTVWIEPVTGAITTNH